MQPEESWSEDMPEKVMTRGTEDEVLQRVRCKPGACQRMSNFARSAYRARWPIRPLSQAIRPKGGLYLVHGVPLTSGVPPMIPLLNLVCVNEMLPVLSARASSGLTIAYCGDTRPARRTPRIRRCPDDSLQSRPQSESSGGAFVGRLYDG